MSDIDAAPAANLDLPRDDDPEAGSLERGIAGDYTFTIGEVLKEAWARSEGAKLTLNLAMLAYVVIYLAAAGIAEFALTPLIEEQPLIIAIAFIIFQQLFLLAIALPLAVGIFILGVRRAASAPIAVAQIFNHYHKLLSLLGANILMTIAIFIGFALLVIPGIYLAIALMFTLALVVEKSLSPLAALSASRKAVHVRWFPIAGFCLVLMLINAVAAIPLGIGLIWTVPFSVIACGVLYRRIFGCEPETLA